MASSSSQTKSRATTSKGVVVWEWFNEHGKWHPYSPEIVAFIDKEGLNSSQVNLGTVSPALKMYTIDIPSMCQIRKGTGTSRPVRRVIYPAGSLPAQAVTWEFEGDQPGQWVAYDMDISSALEHAYQNGHQMLDMNTLFQLPYSAHFTTMQQVRMNTGRTRKIRRSSLQTPYPSVTKSPKCYSKLTSILPGTSLASSAGNPGQPSTSPAGNPNQPSTSGYQAPVNSTAGASSLGGSTSGTAANKKGKRIVSSSDSESDSDSLKGTVRRLRTRKFVKRTPSQGSSSGKNSSKVSAGTTSAATIKMSAPPSSLTSNSISSSHLSVQSSMVHQNQLNHSAMSGMNPLANQSYPMPTVSLASTGPTLPLSLVTYAQPLGANLTRGFPPMTHLPPSQQTAHSHHPATHNLSLSHSSPAQLPVTAHISVQSQVVPVQSVNMSHSVNFQPSFHPQVISASTSHIPSTSQAPIPAHGFANQNPGIPVPGNSSWAARGLIKSSSLPVTAHSMTMMSTSQPGPSTSSLSQTGSSSDYQGPLTRNRLLKQRSYGMTGTISGRGMGVPAGTNVHSLLSGLPQGFNSSQHQGLVAVGSSNPHHQSAAHQAVPAQQPGHRQHLHQMQHLQQLQQQHHQQQQQQQQQQFSGLGFSSGYPFNQSSFVPTLGLNILPGSALLLPGSGTAGQHNISATPGAGSNPQGLPPAILVTESLPTETRIVLPKKRKAKTKSKTAEEVLCKYMEPISHQENEDCCICFDALTAPSSYGEGKEGQSDVVKLNKCSHMFHRLCLLAMYDSSHNGDSLQCPTCKTIYGELIGNCPPGEMSYDILSRPLPGYSNCATIRVTYYISPGVQGPEHPHPSQRFTARGFPRAGFLPDNNRGRKILKLLMLAFQRKLMFTIGTSATTGETDTVTWNEIHHKTEYGSNVSGHGYPDPNYLDNVTAELALKGVTEQDL